MLAFSTDIVWQACGSERLSQAPVNEVDADRKKIEDLLRERDILNKNVHIFLSHTSQSSTSNERDVLEHSKTNDEKECSPFFSVRVRDVAISKIMYVIIEFAFRRVTSRQVIKTDERTKKQIDLVKRQETQQHNLAKDIQRWKADAVHHFANVCGCQVFEGSCSAISTPIFASEFEIYS